MTEAYGVYLLIVAGSHLDILANRLATLGHATAVKHITMEQSFRVDCIQTYTKIARLGQLGYQVIKYLTLTLSI